MFPSSAFVSTVDLARTLFPTVRSEDAVRELIVSPVLGAAGYQHASVYSVERGFRFPATQLNRSSGGRRHHVAPDLLLRVLDRPVWIVEVKVPRVDLADPRYVDQLGSYLRSAGARCPRGILTNGRRWDFYRLAGARPRLIRSVDIFHTRSLRSMRSLQSAIDPARSYLRGLTAFQVYEIYLEGDWIVRNICMAELRTRPLAARRQLVSILKNLFDAPTVRERSLPAILLFDDPERVELIFERAMNDEVDTVRDTAFTIVRSLAMSHGDFALSERTLEAVPSGWFSRITYVQMLTALIGNAKVPAGLRSQFFDQLELLERDPDNLVRAFARFGLRGIATPFPFSAFTHRPTYSSDQNAVDEAMLAATLRLAVDSDYAPESRTSAIDAVRASQLPDGPLRRMLSKPTLQILDHLRR